MDDDDNLIYEQNESGESVVVKSLDCSHRSLIRVKNNSFSAAEIYWIDYSGKMKYYVSLEHEQFIDLNTYSSHPWIFKDTKFGEHLMAKNQTILRPAPVKMIFSPALKKIVPWRDLILICLPMRSLKMLAMMEIVESLNSLESLKELGLPYTLVEDLTILFEKYLRTKSKIRSTISQNI